MFEEIGRNTADGYALGIDGRTAEVSDSMMRMIALPETLSLSAGAQRQGPVSITIPITIEGRGESDDALVEKLEARLPYVLSSLFERLAIETGET